MIAQLLRQAADLIEQRSAVVSGDWWEAVENYPDAWVVRARSAQPATRKGVRNPTQHSFYVASESSEGDIQRSDADWMAMMGPQIAAPIVAWLRSEADQFDQDGWDSAEDDWAPLVFARWVLQVAP